MIADDNNSEAPDGFKEFMDPSDVNNAAREVMAAVARWHMDVETGLASTGSANSYAVTTVRVVTSLVAGLTIRWRPNHTNTGPATLNVNALGARPIRKHFSTDMATADLQAGGSYVSTYDAVNAVWHTLGAPSAIGSVSYREYSGDGVTVAFTLPADPGSVYNTEVWVHGVRQHYSTYSVSGTTLTFSEAPPSGTDNVGIKVLSPAPAAVIEDGSVDAAALAVDAVETTRIKDANVTTAKVADNAVTLAKLEDGTQGDVLYYGASGAPARLGAGTDGYALVAQGAAANPKWKRRGRVVDVQTATDSGAYTNSTTQINRDDTVPQQSGEGLLIVQKAVTPQVGDRLLISATAQVSTTAARNVCIALFRDSGEDAIAHAWRDTQTNLITTLTLDHPVESAPGGAQAYKIHIGSSDGSAVYINGLSTGRIGGGNLKSTLKIEVISQVAGAI